MMITMVKKTQSLSVAQAKARMSELIGRVAFGGASFTITQRGRPMAKLVPVQDDVAVRHLGDVRGWLAEDDPFFDHIDGIVRARAAHRPRVLHGVKVRR